MNRELSHPLFSHQRAVWERNACNTTADLIKKGEDYAKTIAGFILSLVSIPQAYLRRTSDVNRSNFSVSRLLCSLGNACSSKPPKYTFKARSTRLTSLLTLYQNKIRKLKHQSRFNEIRRLHLAGN